MEIDLTTPDAKKNNVVMDLTTPVNESVVYDLTSPDERRRLSFDTHEEIALKLDDMLLESSSPPAVSDLALERTLEQYGIKPKKSRSGMEEQLRQVWQHVAESEAKTARKVKIRAGGDHFVVTQALKRNESMYQKIVMYQPVELEQVMEYLSRENISISKKNLIRYFDAQGAFFKSVKH